MAIFVHLTAEKNCKSILRNGLSRMRKRSGNLHGVFALPVTPNFFVSHQWLRELKGTRNVAIAGVYIRIPDDESVWVGHYSRAHQRMTAAEAAGLMMTENREGYEVIIPRKIHMSEIHRIKILPQVVGWRYFPGAHDRPPCGCPNCQRGNYGARKLREEYEKQ
jgi:hypothetical protein